MVQKKKINVLMLGPDLDVKGGISSVEKLILKYKPEDINIIFIPTMKEGSKSYKAFVFMVALMQIPFTLFTQKIDIVHIHFSSNASLVRKCICAAIVNLCNKPFLMHAHGATLDKHLKSINRVYFKITSFVFLKNIKLITLSKYWKDFFLSTYNLNEENVIELPNPVEMPTCISKHNDETTKFLYLGIIDDRKGAFRAIEAFSRLASRTIENINFILAGNGEVEKAREYVDKLNLTNKIKIKDWINNEKKEELLRNSDIFILPSRNEGLPMAMLEAMSYGLAVIVSPVGGIPEVIKNGINGLFVDPNDIQDISNKIKELIENKELIKSLGENAKQSVSKYGVERYWETLRKIYE